MLTILIALLPKSNTRGSTGHREKHDAVFTIDDLLILRGRTSHTRFFPAFHSFNYSYLMVGVPLHSIRGNWLVSVDEPSWWKRGWLRIEAKDHLERGKNEHGIRRKLDLYLTSQVSPSDFPVRSRGWYRGCGWLCCLICLVLLHRLY